MNEDLEFKDIDEDDEEEVKIPEIHGTKNYMTRACYNRLLDERKNLVLVERPNVVNVVAWAASNGDRSENADYQYGKQRLREIDRRIRFLNKRIEASEVIDIDKRPPTDQIFFGATIVYANEQGDESKIRIVGIDEADADEVLMVGDSPYDEEGAAAVGCRFAAATYGFGYLGMEESQIEADALVHSVEELADYLQNS